MNNNDEGELPLEKHYSGSVRTGAGIEVEQQ
jgi:hypothetical protein